MDGRKPTLQVSAKPSYHPLISPRLRSTPNRCACGNLILQTNKDGRSSPQSLKSGRKKDVFNRLYATRLTYEKSRRKKAEAATEEEAKECIYIPRTNHFRESMKTSSSVAAMEDRERKVDRARQQYHAGQLCDECYKSIEVGTGTFSMENMLGPDDTSTVTSRSRSNRPSFIKPPIEISFSKTSSFAPKPLTPRKRKKKKNRTPDTASPALSTALDNVELMESPDEAESEESDKERSDRTVATEGTLASGSATDKCEENGSADGKSQHSDGMDYMCGLDNCLDPATAKQTEENHAKDSESAGPFDEEKEDQSQASAADKSTEHNKDITLSSSKDIPPPQVVQSESVDPDLSREAETGDQLCQEEVQSVDVVGKQGSDLVVDEGLGVSTKSTISDLDSTSGHNRNTRNNPKELIGRDVEHPKLQSSQSNASNVVAEEDNPDNTRSSGDVENKFASKDDNQALAPQGNEENLASNKDLREKEIDSLSEILNGNPDSEVAADDATSPWTNRGVRIPPSSSCAPNLEPDRSDVSDTVSKVDRKPEPKQECGVPLTKSHDSELPTRLGETDREIHETNKDSRDAQEYLYPDDEGGDPLSGHLADAEDDLEPSDTKDTLASVPSEEVAGLCGASTCLGDYCGGNGSTVRPDRGNPSAVQTPRSRAASLSPTRQVASPTEPKRIEWNKPISIRTSLTNDGVDGKSHSQPGTPTVNQFVFGKTVVTVKVRVDRPDTSPLGNADKQLIVHTPQSLQGEQVENGKKTPESNPAVQTETSDGLGSRQFAREQRKEEMVSEDKNMSLVVKSSLEEQSEENKMGNCQQDATVNETEPTTGDGVTPPEEPRSDQQSIDSTELAAEISTESSSAEVELLCVPSKSQSREDPESTALQQQDERVLVPSPPPKVEKADPADDVKNTNDVVKAVEEGAHDSEAVTATVSRTSSHQVIEADAIDTCAIEAGAIEASDDELMGAENKDDAGSPALDNDDLSIKSTEVLVLGNGSIKTKEDGHRKLSVIDFAEKSPSVDDNDAQTNQVGSVAVAAAAARSPAAFPPSPSSKSRTLSILLDDEELSMESRNDELLEDRVAGHAYHRCGDSVECDTDRKEEEEDEEEEAAADGACIECGDAKEGQGPATASDKETTWAPDMSVPLFVEITFTKKRSFFCSQFMEDVYDGCNRLCGVDDLTTNSSGRDEAPTAREGSEGERISL